MRASGPLRVAHVVLALQPGGLERLVVDLANGADRGRVTPMIVCTDVLGALATERSSDVSIECLDARPGLDWRAVRSLAGILRRERIDVVHSHNQRAHYLATPASILARAPVRVNTWHGTHEGGHRPRGRVRRRILNAFTDSIVGVSAAVHDKILEQDRAPRRKVRTILNGTPIGRPRLAREDARRALGLGDGDLVVGAIGRLSAEKSYSDLLAAMAIDARIGGRWSLALIGHGPEASALRSQAEALGIGGRVRFGGFRADAASLLLAFDAFAQPSLSEGISISILEAMAASLPIVATAIPGNVEALGEDGAALLVPVRAPEEIASALARLAASPELRATLGATARARVEARFSLPAMARAYEALYLEIARAKGLRP